MASLQAARTLVSPEEAVEEYARALDSSRARTEDAEKMYEALKKVHEDCMEEFRVIQNQTQKLLGESEQKLKKSDGTIRELRRTVLDQSREISEMKPNLFTPQKQELLRLTIQAEYDKLYQNKLRSLYDENIAIKSRLATVSHENEVVRADLDRRENDYKRSRNDLVNKYERKIDDLKAEKEAVALVVPPIDGQRYRQLQRDNDQLEMRVKAQEIELETTRLTKGKLEEEQDRVYKSQARQLVEKTFQLENLKAESEIQQQHNESLRKQLSELIAENAQCSQKVQTLDDEKHSLMTEIESLGHHHQIELGSIRVKFTTEKISVQKVKDQLEAELENVKGQLQLANQGLDMQRENASVKERDAQMKINSLIQQHVNDCAKLEQDKHSLETKLVSTERRITENESVFQEKLEKVLEDQKTLVTTNTSLHKELDSFRVKIADYQRKEIEFSKQHSDHVHLQKEMKSLMSQIVAAEETLRNLESEKRNLEQIIGGLNERNDSNNNLLKEVAARHSMDKAELEKSWAEKRNNYALFVKEQERRLVSKQQEYLKLEEKFKTLVKKYSSYKKRTKTITDELVSAVKAKSALVDLAKDAVTPTAYQKVQDELVQLKRLLGRVKNIMLLATPGMTGIQFELSQVGRPQTGKEIGDAFDQHLRNKEAAHHLWITESESLEQLFTRLRPLGFNDSDTEVSNSMIDDREGSDDVSSTKAPSVHSRIQSVSL